MNSPRPEVRYTDIPDSRLEYLYYDGDGPDIIMLHATGFLPWLWHPIAKQLSGSYKITAPYFCDHRDGEPENGGVSWLKLADDLCALCKNNGIEDPLLVGHSMGATVIALAAALHGLSAGRLILIEPIFLPEQIYSAGLTVEQHPLASKSIKRRNGWESSEDALSYLKSKPLFASWDDEALELYVKYGMISGETGGLTLACPPRKEAALFMGSVEFNPWPVLDKISVPALLLEGEKSENRAFIDLQKAASLMKQGSYRQIKDAGHLIPMEKPNEITQIIKEALK